METITPLQYFQGIALRILLEREPMYKLSNIETGSINGYTNADFYEKCKTASTAIAESMIAQPPIEP